MIIIAVVKNLLVRAGADFSPMKQSMQGIQKDLRDFKNNINSTMKGIAGALASLGIGMVIRDAVKSATAVEASVMQLNRTLGTNAQAFVDWANKSAIAFNMGKSDALKFGAVFSNLTSTFSQDTATTLKYTQELLKASAVVAAGTGRSMEDTMERIRSGLLGNTEAIEDLGIHVGISMIESTKAFAQFANGRSWDQIDFQTQQQIRLFAILEQSTRKYGDTVANNTASKQQQFVAQLKNVQLALGQAFLPIWNAVLPALTRMAAAMASVMNVVAQFMSALFGGEAKETKAQAQATTAQAGAVGALGDAYKDAGKKAQGSLASFDEVNQLADSSGGGSAGAGGAGAAAGMPGMGEASGVAKATQAIAESVRAMADKVRHAFQICRDGVKAFFGFLVDHKDFMIAALAGIAAGMATWLIATNWAAIIAGIRAAFIGMAVSIEAVWAALTGPIGLVVLAIAAVVAAFVYFYRTNETFRGFVDGILRDIGQAAKWLWINVLVPFGQWLGTVLVAAWEKVKVAAEWLWKNVLVPLGNFLLWFWNNVITPLAKVLGEALGVAFKVVAEIAMSFWKNVMIPLGEFFKNSFGPAVTALSTVFTFLWKSVLQPLGTFLGTILKPVFKGLTDVIVFLWQNVLKPVAVFVGGVFVKVFDSVFKTIGAVIGDLQTAFNGLMTFITGVFSGNWAMAWEGVKKVFKGVFDSLYDIVKNPLNSIIDMINKVIEGLNSISIDLPLGGGTIGVSIPKIPKLANGGITNGPMMAMIGDNPGGKEVVSPLSDLKDIIASAVGTAVMAAAQMSNGNNQHGGDIVMKIDGSTFARVLRPYMQKEDSRFGPLMIRTT